MKRVGIIGWRGMVGSVLMDRLKSAGDLEHFEPYFFSTSQVGQTGPDLGTGGAPLLDAHAVDQLRPMDFLVSCQGGDYTRKMHPDLRSTGWNGTWIDAASALRMEDHSVIALDPVNRPVIDRAMEQGVRDFIGGNCTVSLMLMGLYGLFQQGWVEWVSTMTYQSASGGGAKHMVELVDQMGDLAACRSPGQSALELERQVTAKLNSDDIGCDQFGVPLAGSLIPWIDREMPNGQTREEWKGSAEANKILGNATPIPIDGQCVRVGAMRCHSQAVTIKLNQNIPLSDIEAAIAEAHPWVRVVPNTRDETCQWLTPAAVSGTMSIPVGRIRKMLLGPEYLTVFTVGDQLLWGAAEPIRRMLMIALGAL